MAGDFQIACVLSWNFLKWQLAGKKTTLPYIINAILNNAGMGAYMWVHVWQQVLIRENYNLYCASKLTELPAQSLARSAQDLIRLRKEVSEHKNLRSGVETQGLPGKQHRALLWVRYIWTVHKKRVKPSWPNKKISILTKNCLLSWDSRCSRELGEQAQPAQRRFTSLDGSWTEGSCRAQPLHLSCFQLSSCSQVRSWLAVKEPAIKSSPNGYENILHNSAVSLLPH